LRGSTRTARKPDRANTDLESNPDPFSSQNASHRRWPSTGGFVPLCHVIRILKYTYLHGNSRRAYSITSSDPKRSVHIRWKMLAATCSRNRIIRWSALRAHRCHRLTDWGSMDPWATLAGIIALQSTGDARPRTRPSASTPACDERTDGPGGSAWPAARAGGRGRAEGHHRCRHSGREKSSIGARR
jgi:hypothetical protein